MSGVVILYNPVSPIDNHLLVQMTECMAAHGPDALDTWTAPHGMIGFGHTLLRLTHHQQSEQQPLTSDEQAWIVADARLDDRATLLSQLRTYDRIVRDDAPDVNLILHAYHVWGDACHEHLLGDFGFVIWDERRQMIYGARDHLGVTPLYYAEVEGGIAMSTTLEALRLHPQVSDGLNEQAIGDYLLFGCNQEVDTTFFTDIRCVPPAHCFRWVKNKLHLERYWQLDEAAPLRYARAEEYTEHFLDIFTSAVLDRTRTDKAVVSMSGGLDSTSIAVVAHRAYRDGTSPAEIHTYCAGFDWLLPDEERYWASLVAEHAGLPITYLSSEEALHAETLQAAWLLTPEPCLVPRKPVSYELMKQTHARGVRIVLNGLGGDPLFSLPDGRSVRPRSFPSRVRKRVRHLAGFGRGLFRSSSPPTLDRTTEAQHLGWIDPDFKNRLQLRKRWQEQTQTAARLKGPQQMAEHPFWHGVLTASHPGFSSFPMKTRFPFFDVRLLTYINRIPAERRRQKQLLREAMQGLLPDPVRFRKKTPLQANFLHALALRGQEPDMEPLATHPMLAPYIDQNRLESIVRAPADLHPTRYFQQVVLPLGLAYWLARQQHDRPEPLPTSFFGV